MKKIVLAGLLFFFLPVLASASQATIPLTDNFDSYTAGNLTGQGFWQQQGGDPWTVTSVSCGGSKCIESAYNTSGHNPNNFLWTLNPIGSYGGSISLSIKTDGSYLSSYAFGVGLGYVNPSVSTTSVESEFSPAALDVNGCTSGDMCWHDGAGNPIGLAWTNNVWHTVVIYWVVDPNAGCRWSISMDGSAPVQTYDDSTTNQACTASSYAQNGINAIDLDNFAHGATTYVDNVNGASVNSVLEPIITNVGVATSSIATFCNGSFSTSSSLLSEIGSSISVGFCNATSFLFVPSPSQVNTFTQSLGMITQKAPFVWITSVRTDLDALSASTSENFIDLNLNFGTTTAALGIGSLDVISTSTMSKYYPDSTRETARNLIGVVFALLAVSFFYRKLQNIWHAQV